MISILFGLITGATAGYLLEGVRQKFLDSDGALGMGLLLFFAAIFTCISAANGW